MLERQAAHQEKRVDANSIVNCSPLSEEELVQRYRNMLIECNQLKKQVKLKEQET